MAKEKKSYEVKDFAASKWPVTKYHAATKVAADPQEYQHLSSELKEDPEIALLALSKCDDEDLLNSLKKESGAVVKDRTPYVGVLAAAKKDYRIGLIIDGKGKRSMYMYLPESVKAHDSVVTSHITCYPDGYADLPDSVKKEKKWTKLAMDTFRYNAEYFYAMAPKEIREDTTFLLRPWLGREDKLRLSAYEWTARGYTEKTKEVLIKDIVPDKIKKDKETMLTLMVASSANILLADKELFKDREFLDDAVMMSAGVSVEPELPDEIKNDRDLALKYAPVSSWYAVLAAKTFNDDEEVMLAALKLSWNIEEKFRKCSTRLKSDKNFIDKCMKLYPRVYPELDDEFKKNPEYLKRYLLTIRAATFSHFKLFAKGDLLNEDIIRFALDLNEKEFAPLFPVKHIMDIDPTLLARLAEEYRVFNKAVYAKELAASKKALEKERAEKPEIKPETEKPAVKSKPEEKKTPEKDIPSIKHSGFEVIGASLLTEDDYDFCRDLIPAVEDKAWWLNDKGRQVTGEGEVVESHDPDAVSGIRPVLDYKGELNIGDSVNVTGTDFTVIFGNKMISNEVLATGTHKEAREKVGSLSADFWQFLRDHGSGAVIENSAEPVAGVNKETKSETETLVNKETFTTREPEKAEPGKTEESSVVKEPVKIAERTVSEKPTDEPKPRRYMTESKITGTIDERLEKAKTVLPHVTGKGIMGQAGPAPRNDEGVPQAVIASRKLF